MPRYHYYDGDTFERGGRTFRVNHPYDDCEIIPWKEYDGCGIVSDWTTRDKAPGERILATDRHSRMYYDFAATIAKAKAEGWGLAPPALAELALKLTRRPTRKEIVAEAVERDFRHLYGFANDEWTYVCLEVTEIESGETEYLGGMESDDYDGLRDEAHYLADIINDRLNEQAAAEIEETRESVSN